MSNETATVQPRWGPWVGVAIAAAAVVGGLALAMAGARRAPLAASWRAVVAAEGYDLSGTTAVALDERVVRYVVHGQGTSAGELRLTVSAADGTGGTGGPAGGTGPELADAPATGSRAAPDATPEAATTWLIRWPDVRDGAGRVIEPRSLAAVLPLGDPLALLAVAHGQHLGELETVAGATCRRVDFLVAGRAYQRWWEGHRAFLPFNADAGGMTTFAAEGTAWVDPQSRLPCRIRVRSGLPRTPGEGRGTAEVDWQYGGWVRPVRP